MKNVITFNHINEKLSKEEQEELISYYKTYHRKVWAFKKHYKHYKRLCFIANTTSLLIANSSIASSIIFLPAVAISSLAILIQSYIKYKDYDFKIRTSLHAFQTYLHLLSEIKNILRSGDFEKESLLIQMNVIDGFIIDNTPLLTNG